MRFEPGTRQAYLPGGHRTGAPGKHVIRGKAKYRLEDEKVRVYVAPPIEQILSSPVRPSEIICFIPCSSCLVRSYGRTSRLALVSRNQNNGLPLGSSPRPTA